MSMLPMPQPEIDPVTGLPMRAPWMTPPIVPNPTMGMPAPQHSAGGLLGRVSGAFGGSQGLLNLGANLMAASGPSDQRVSFGQALGSSLLANQQFQRQQGNDMLQAMLLKTKLQPKKPRLQEDYEYAKAQGFKGSIEEWRRVSSAQGSTPAEVQAYEYWKSLPTQQERDDYLTVKRNMQPWQWVESAGGRGGYNRATNTYTPFTTAQQEASGAGQIAAGTAGGKVAGEAQSQAQVDMPTVADKANEALSLVDQLRNHPGRKMATGGSRLLQVQRVPGTPAYDFDVMRGQVGGQQFLQAYETLKGGGQITEVEGKEAKSAIARMDASQSEDAYLKALDDYERIIKKGVERAKRKASGVGVGATGSWSTPQSGVRRVRVDANGNPL